MNVPLPGDLQLRLVNNIDEAMEMKRWLGDQRRDILAVDTETGGLDPYSCGLRLIQIGDERSGWAVPWNQWGGVALEILNSWDGEYAFHNAAFDIRFLKMHGGWDAPWHRVHDTMIMAQICDPLGPGGLKPLGNKHVDRRASAGDALLKEAMAKEGWTWANIPVDYDAYWAYGALDTVITAHLYKHFRADQAYPRVYELEMATRRCVSQMEDNGCPIDVAYCKEKYQRMSDYVEMSKEWGKRELGVGIGSNVQLVRYFTELGAEITEKTAGGSPSMSKYQLDLLINGYPDTKIANIAQFVLNVRKADKLAGTYFANFISMHQDGILHPSVKTLGARTGRMSITAPALQTLPRESGAIVRNAFIPHEGNALVSADYSQIEARLMSHFSQDEKLITTFNEADSSGGDFFTAIAADIYQDPNLDKKDPRRALTKNTVYGKLYGAGVTKMAETAGVPYSQMKAVVDAFDTRYPGVRQFQKTVEDAGFRRERDEGQGYVLTPFGRRLPCDERKTYALVNYCLQGHAAELLKDAIVKMDQAGLGEYMLLPVHDEVIFSIPKEDVDDVMHSIGEIMSIREGYAVPIPADPEGPLQRWGEKYE